MKTIYLVRHAKSSWDDPRLLDIERPLNNTGQKVAREMSELLSRIASKPDLLVSSPAVRAFSTAQFFAKAFDIPENEIKVEDSIYEAMTRDVISLIHKLPDLVGSAFIFGHNPTMTNLTNLFSKHFFDNVPTCGVLCIVAKVEHWKEFNDKTAKLEKWYFPKDVL